MTKSIRSILLVDNDDQARENLAVKLRNDIGCVVIEASQPADADAILQDENVNLLITDLFMPASEGIDLLKAVRADEKLKDLPVLMVTAEAKREQIVTAAQAGVNGYVVKPFTAQTLKEKIDKVFERLEATA